MKLKIAAKIIALFGLVIVSGCQRQKEVAAPQLASPGAETQKKEMAQQTPAATTAIAAVESQESFGTEDMKTPLFTAEPPVPAKGADNFKRPLEKIIIYSRPNDSTNEQSAPRDGAPKKDFAKILSLTQELDAVTKELSYKKSRLESLVSVQAGTTDGFNSLLNSKVERARLPIDIQELTTKQNELSKLLREAKSGN